MAKYEPIIITELNVILANKNIDKNTIMYINIDRGLLMTEYLLHRACKSNMIIKNKIIRSTKRMEFNNTDKLVPIKYNYIEFIKKYQDKYSKIYFITWKDKSEYGRLTNDLDSRLKNIPIVSLESLKEDAKKNNIVYLDCVGGPNIDHVFNKSLNNYIYRINLLG
jgi:hypothetical protein